MSKKKSDSDNSLYQRNKFKQQKENTNKIQTNKSLIRRSEYPNYLYQSTNANNWEGNRIYKYKELKNQVIKIIPISGVEMVGANCTVIESDEDLILIDIGLGFPETDLLGIDAIIPNLEYVKNKIHKLRGIIVTHGHTDHIGGIPYLYQSIGSPIIYSPRLAAEMLREKFKELKIQNYKIDIIDGNSVYYLGKFRISHFRMNHTIMDNYGVCIDTPIGKIVITGDYKFDLTPYKEPPSDYSKLARIGDDKVLVLLDESTNVKNIGWAPSESSIAYDLENIIRDTNGRLIIGLFSTMISRIRQISELSHKYGKKVAVVGKSLQSNISIAYKLGYIDVSNSLFIDLKDINKFSDDSLVILATGSQGEPNSALMKIALDEHENLQLKPTDTIVFSSSRIPGNEQKIDRLINLISEKKCKVITSENLTLHATGHGFSEDHKLMIQLIKPKFIIPIHGDQSMLVANRENAKKLGYRNENIIIPRNGDVIEVKSNNCTIIDNVHKTHLWLENNKIYESNEDAMKERRISSENGFLICVIKKNNKPSKYQPGDIKIIAKGIVNSNLNKIYKIELIPKIVEDLKKFTIKKQYHNEHNLQTHVTHLIKKFMINKFNVNPLIEVIVI